MSSFLLIVLATLLCGTFLTLRDLPLVHGSIMASGAGEELSVKILVPLLMLAALFISCLFPGALMQSSAGIVSAVPESMLFPVGIATLATCIITGLVSRFPAAPLAFTGALTGIARACGSTQAWTVNAGYLLSWIIATLLCGAVAAGIYYLGTYLARKHNTHFILMEARILKIATLASLLLAAAFVWNNAPLFCLLPSITAGNGYIAAGIAFSCALFLYAVMHRRVSGSTWNTIDSDLDTDSLSILALVSSMAIVLALFSCGFICKAGLAATPLPVGLLFVSALTGISITRGQALIEGEEIGRCILAAILAPVLGAITGYCLCRIIDGDLANTIIVLCLCLLVTALIVYIRWQARHDLQKQIVRAREQQVYSTQKSLSALEVKAETTEKDLLGKLEHKRKELVDFAVGISDQKKFMEETYEELKKVRSMPDGAAKNACIDELLSALRERMYFTREMNDFYARSEVLHKDFNMRLSERFPSLTEAERKLANLLRQGFSSKYIASLMNITPKSVEISRYRLRIKLGLERSDNLIQFIKSI